MWEFDGYVVYKETDLLRFEGDDDRLLGYVAFDDGGDQVVDDLNVGSDPIRDGWEDGVGNTLSMNGWGEVDAK